MIRNSHNINRVFSLTLAGISLAVALPFAAEAQQTSSEWNWSVTPYVWATDVGVDVTVDDRQVIDEVITVEELLEDVETIAQIRLEARKGAHGLFVDLFDVNLADHEVTVSLPAGSGSATLDPEMGMTILDLGGIYDPRGDGRGLQLLYGTRILNERATIDASFVPTSGESFTHEIEIDDVYVDALAGFRYVRPVGDRVSVQFLADISAGGTDLTWSVAPTISYTFGDTGRYSAIAGYRYMTVEFDTADNVDATMTMSGIVAGLRIAF